MITEFPWATTGKNVSGAKSTADILKKAGLDWTVLKVGTLAEGRSVSLRSKALLRVPGDILLGEGVGENWTDVQNSDAFDLFHDIADRGRMSIRYAGSFKRGQVVWAIAEAGSFVVDGDRVTTNVLFTNPHQYGSSIDARFMTVRETSMCTMTWGAIVQFHHRRSLDERVVDEMSVVVAEQSASFRAAAERMRSRTVDAARLEGYLRLVFPARASVARAMEISGRPEFAGDAWGAFNLVCFMCDHALGNGEDTRLLSAWYGKNWGVKTRALRLATTL